MNDEDYIELMGGETELEKLRNGSVVKAVSTYDIISSNIHSVKWVPTEVTSHAVYGDLHVVYGRPGEEVGGEYVYERVSAQRFARIVAANSVGRYMNGRVKPNYNCKKIGEVKL
jgi:KTSC domain-containing protein